jgi:CHAT domain-containing protein/tetratricopeptide (TPR) repeat protein
MRVNRVLLDRRLAMPLLLLCPAAHAQIAAATPILIPGAAAQEFAIPPSFNLSFSVQIPANEAALLTVEEEDQTSFVTWTDIAGTVHTPRTDRDGQLGKIRFTLLGGAEGSQQFAVNTSSKRRTAHVRVWVSDPHAETAGDRNSVVTEESLAEADFLWGKHDPHNAPAALAAYDHAIEGSRQLDDATMLRRSLTWKAIYLAFTTGDAQAALPLVTEATAIPGADDTTEQASAWKALGMVQTTLADYTDGWQAYAKALVLFENTGDRFNQEVLLENRGKLSRLTGDYAGALQDLDAAAGLARALDDAVGALHIEDEIAVIHLLRGEMQPAFDAYQDVLALNSLSPADPMIGFAETDLANLYHQLGGDTQSRAMLMRADEFWKDHPYLIGELATLDQQGRLAIDSGDLLQASAIYQHGLELAQEAKTKREEVFFLLGLGRIAADRRQYVPATDYLDRASQLASSLAATDAMVQIHIAQGDLALDNHKAQDAEAHYRQALTLAEQSFDQAGTITAQGGLARTSWTLGRDMEASRHMEQALAGIESTRDVIKASSLRTAYFSSRHSYYDLAIEILMHLDQTHPGAGYDEGALETAERARSRFLREQMEQAGADVARNTDPALAASRAKTLRELHLAEASLAALRPGERPAQAQSIRKRVAELLEEEDRIEAATDTVRARQSIGAIAVRTHALSGTAPHLTTELQRRLGSGTALLEYWTGKNASYLWVITSASLHSYTLPSSEAMNSLALRLGTELQKPFAGTPVSAESFAISLNQAEEQFETTALRLGRALLPPRALMGNLHTLLLVGDGALLSVPFEALRLASAGAASGIYVQERYSVVREPSIRVLLDLWNRHEQSPPMKIAVIADPVFGADDPRLLKRTASDSGPKLRIAPSEPKVPNGPASSIVSAAESRTDWTNLTGSAQLRRLSFAGPEAADIASLAGPNRSDLASGFAATVEHVRSMDWTGYTIAHFATHALLNPSRPELAGIVLSAVNASGTAQPGILWLSDIYELHMPIGMVVLSACQTSNGKLLPGEGLIGVSHAFFVAGARRVVGSLWDVDDAATGKLIRLFYTGLLERDWSPAESLRRAQIELSKDSRWKNPYYWAGFTIEGDPRGLSQ